ncbi:2736_t:CDS:2, partial [Racocetra fulgida]
IKIHHTTGLAYLACGDEQGRKTQWFPPNDVLNYSYHPRETFYVYNTETDKLTPLTLKNFADEEDFSLHGFGMYEDPAESEIAVDGLMFANGINTNWDYSHIFVGAVGTGELLVYERKPDNKLKLLEAVQVEYAIDNVSVDPVTGEIYLAVMDVFLHLNGIKDAKLAFSVLKVSNNTGENKFYGIKYEKKKIFEDDGTLFGAVSVAAGDSVRKVMLLGSFHTPGVIRCELN